jgi:FecR protein
MIDAELIQRYLDGELDEPTTKKLSQWLSSSPENRALFRHEIALAETLVQAAITAHTAVAPSARATSQRSGSSPRNRTNSSSRVMSSHRLKQAHPSRVTSRLFILAATAAMVVIGTFILFKESPVAPTPIAAPTSVPTRAQPTHDLVISHVQGSMNVVRGNAPLKTLPTKLEPGDQIILGSQATAELTMDQGRTQLWASSDTNFIIASIKDPHNRTGTQLKISSGSVLIKAAPQPTSAPLRLSSPRSEAEIVGTVLSFTVLPDRDRVVVGHGIVDYALSNHTQRARLDAGSSAVSDGISLVTNRLNYQPPAPVVMARITGFSLIDSNTNTPIPGYEKLESGCVIDVKKISGRPITMCAEVSWTQTIEGKVSFHYNNNKPYFSRSAPYNFPINLPAINPVSVGITLTNGVHSVVATPFSGFIRKVVNDKFQDGVKDQPGHSATLIFTVINASP